MSTFELENAVRRSQIETIKSLAAAGVPCGYLSRGIWHNNLEAIKLYYSLGGKTDKWEDMAMACRSHGSIEMIDFMLSIGAKLTEYAYASALHGGTIEVIKYLDSLQCPRPGPKSLCMEAVHNSVEVMKYAVSIGGTLSAAVFAEAGCACNVAMFKYLVECKCPIDDEAITGVVRCCNIELASKMYCCEYLYSVGCAVSQDSFLAALRLPDPSIIRWMFARGLTWENALAAFKKRRREWEYHDDWLHEYLELGIEPTSTEASNKLRIIWALYEIFQQIARAHGRDGFSALFVWEDTSGTNNITICSFVPQDQPHEEPSDLTAEMLESISAKYNISLNHEQFMEIAGVKN